ncbi:21586_t:CDS:2 [Entrophospora sp. SA101]|nr:21586_t:CDS:2 [Entrophospora sp. SA101]
MTKRLKIHKSNDEFLSILREPKPNLAPRSIKSVEDAIDRTPEYTAFIKSLEEFHKDHGTTFQKEPVLGSKKLDLYKIYQMVIAEGGCERICAEKSWKKICEPFNFPQTCTNSAFVMKNIYIRFLEPYELEHFWGKKVPYAPVPSNRALKIVPYEIPRNEYSILSGGHLNRILLALKSQLANEIDWALDTLLKVSIDQMIKFKLDKIPELLDIFLTHLSNFYTQVTDLYEANQHSTESTVDDYFNDLNNYLHLQRATQIFLILRNLSFYNYNAELMSFNKLVQKFVMEALTLPAFLKFPQIRIYCIEIIKSMSHIIKLNSSEDELLVVLRRLIFSDDIALVIHSITAMSCLAGNEQNSEFIKDVDSRAVQHLVNLLLIDDDEELSKAVLELLYYLSTSEETASRMVEYAPGNLVRLLIGYLRHGSSVESQIHERIPPIERRPPQLHGDFESLIEPLRTAYEESPFDGVLQTDIWFAYRDQFQNSQCPMMPAAEVIKLVNRVFPDSSAIMVTASDGSYKYMIQGIRPILSKDEIQQDNPLYNCKWADCQEASFEDESKLMEHLVIEHLSERKQYTCNWLNCNRFSSGTENITTVIAHLKTHFPIQPEDEDSKKHKRRPDIVNKYGRNNGIYTYKTYVKSDNIGDAIGIPLLASLVLRNLSLSSANLQHFVAYEKDLAEMLTSCVALSKNLAETLSNMRAI